MVDIQQLPSSNNSLSSSSSSEDDSGSISSNSGSSTDSIHDETSSKQQQGKMTIHASVIHENGAIMQHEQSNNATSAKTRKDTTRPPPVDTVVCVETKPLESANETTNDGTSTFLQEQDVAVFYSDESLSQSKSPLLPPQDLKFDNGGLSDGDLMKLLDSPKVCYTAETTTTTTTTTSASMPAAASSLPFQSPSESTTSVDTENLEIPHACHTPRETASSRFFGAEQPGFNNKDKGTTNPTSVLPQTNKTTPIQDVIDLMDENDTLETNVQARRETTASTAHHEHPHHHDNKETSMNCAAEVDPSVYQPLAYQYKPDPVVHYLSIHNRPKNTRTTIAVHDLFGPPLSGIWKFSSFNPLQSQVANTLAHSDDSIVVSAPTGAGKTCLFEMAMARFFSSTCANKVVYMAPSKALVEERFSDWQERFAILGHHIQCSMITGDAEPGEAYRDVAAANVILTTPEKWDSLTRKWTENVYLFGSVKLLLLDEVHLLGDGTRGSCLESIVCRMKTIQRAAVAASETYDAHASSSSYAHTSQTALSLHLRIVGVSATLPNISSIAAFLDAKEAYSFDASYRPVPLQTHVVGLGWAGKNAFMFAKGLDRHVPDLIKRFSRSKATIVFCHTKKETETLAMELAKVPGIGLPNNGGNMTLASQTKSTVLQGSLLRGIAYHHAGLDASDRKLVETAFMNGKVLVLCATSTLAMGVNLPAHLVMIKGTSAWRGSGQGHQEIDTGTLLQMIGRAGRPGFDTSGTAVIMTDNASKPKYEKLSGGMEVVESQLPPRLMEVMNTEISQRVITSFEAAMNWIKSTFFFRRAMENPQQYGLSSSKSEIEEFMEKNCLDSLERLSKEGIIAFDESGRIEPKAACHTMSQSLVDFESMTRIVSLPFDATSEALLKMLVECDRLHYPVRRSEKKALNETHKLIRYKLDGPPSKVRIQTPTEKAFVLLQAAIGQQYLEDYTLRQEMSHMSEYASRLLKATEECSIEGSLNGHVALQSLRLRRSLATSLWGPGDGVLNQLRGVGHKTTAKLRFSKILSFVDVLSSSSEEIERAAGREAPFGKELRIAVSKILMNTLQLSACVESEEDDLKFVICSLGRRRALPGIENVECDESAGIVNYTLVVFTDRPGGSLVFQPNISTVGEYRLPCPPKCGKIFVHLVASMVGLDECLTLDGNDDVLESAITDDPSDKKKGAKNKATATAAPTSLSPPNEDVRVKRKTAGGKRKKQTTIESSYATGAKRARNTSSRQIQRVEDPSVLTSHREPISQPPRRKTVTNTAPMQDRLPSSTTSVTPSPVPQFSVPKESVPQKFRAHPTSTQMEHQPRPAPGMERLRGSRNSNWRQEKKAVKALQRNGLHQRRDQNLFSSYAHDPNDMESILTSSATKSLSPHPSASEKSVIPPHTYASLKQASASKTRSFSRVSSGRKERGRTRNFPKMPDPRDLLRMKAREQEAYAGQYRQPLPTPRQRYVDNNGFYEPPNESIFPEGHDMRGVPLDPFFNASGPPGFYESYPNNTNPWNSGGFVSQSQQMYSQDATDFGYGQPSRNDFLYAPHPSSAFDPVASQPQFPQMDEPGYAYDQASQRMFSAPQIMQNQGYLRAQLEQPMEALQGFVQSGPNEEDDALFQAAFG